MLKPTLVSLTPAGWSVAPRLLHFATPFPVAPRYTSYDLHNRPLAPISMRENRGCCKVFWNRDLWKNFQLAKSFLRAAQ